MPLAPGDRAQLRYYTGRSARFFQVDSELEQAMNAIDSDDDAVAILQTLIARCQDVDTKLQGADGRQKLEKAEEVTFRGYAELAALRSQGRQAVGRICSMLGVGRRHDVFSGSAPSGAPPSTSPSAWARWGAFGGNGPMKLG